MRLPRSWLRNSRSALAQRGFARQRVDRGELVLRRGALRAISKAARGRRRAPHRRAPLPGVVERRAQAPPEVRRPELRGSPRPQGRSGSDRLCANSQRSADNLAGWTTATSVGRSRSVGRSAIGTPSLTSRSGQAPSGSDFTATAASSTGLGPRWPRALRGPRAAGPRRGRASDRAAPRRTPDLPCWFATDAAAADASRPRDACTRARAFRSLPGPALARLQVAQPSRPVRPRNARRAWRRSCADDRSPSTVRPTARPDFAWRAALAHERAHPRCVGDSGGCRAIGAPRPSAARSAGCRRGSAVDRRHRWAPSCAVEDEPAPGVLDAQRQAFAARAASALVVLPQQVGSAEVPTARRAGHGVGVTPPCATSAASARLPTGASVPPCGPRFREARRRVASAKSSTEGAGARPAARARR